jgi:hypothetical protein
LTLVKATARSARRHRAAFTARLPDVLRAADTFEVIESELLFELLVDLFA